MAFLCSEMYVCCRCCSILYKQPNLATLTDGQENVIIIPLNYIWWMERRAARIASSHRVVHFFFVYFVCACLRLVCVECVCDVFLFRGGRQSGSFYYNKKRTEINQWIVQSIRCKHITEQPKCVPNIKVKYCEVFVCALCLVLFRNFHLS